MEREEYDTAAVCRKEKLSFKITNEMVYYFIDYLRCQGHKFVVSPYEADKQLCELWFRGQIDYIVSEDSDILAYGCKAVIRKVERSGRCQVLDAQSIRRLQEDVSSRRLLAHPDRARFDKAFQFLEQLDRNQKLDVSVLSGCDYLDNVKGFGFGTVIAHFIAFNRELEEPCEQDPERRLRATTRINRERVLALFRKMNNYVRQLDGDLDYVLPEQVESFADYKRQFALVKDSFENQLTFTLDLADWDRIEVTGFTPLFCDDTCADRKVREHPRIKDYVGDEELFQDLHLMNQFTAGLLDFETLEPRPLKNRASILRNLRFIKNGHRPGPADSILLSNLCTQVNSFQGYKDETQTDASSARESPSPLRSHKICKPKNLPHY